MSFTDDVLKDRNEWRSRAEKYWHSLCDVVEALGNIAPEAAPYAAQWAKKVRDERDDLRAKLDTSNGIVGNFEKAIEILRPGHTPHCNSRFVHGDGECECATTKDPVDEFAQMIVSRDPTDGSAEVLAAILRSAIGSGFFEPYKEEGNPRVLSSRHGGAWEFRSESERNEAVAFVDRIRSKPQSLTLEECVENQRRELYRLNSELSAAVKLIGRLRQAIRPFVALLEQIEKAYGSSLADRPAKDRESLAAFFGVRGLMSGITIGDLRRAREVSGDSKAG